MTATTTGVERGSEPPPEQPGHPPLLSLTAAARTAGVSRSTLRRRVAEGAFRGAQRDAQSPTGLAGAAVELYVKASRLFHEVGDVRGEAECLRELAALAGGARRRRKDERLQYAAVVI